MTPMNVRTLTLATVLLVVALLSLPASGEVPSEGTGDVHQRLDAYLQSLADQGFAGVVLMARGGDVIFHEAYGLADQMAGREMANDSVFTVGSISKPFTAVAVLKMEEAGRLRVDDPISKYFEGVPADQQDVTLHHLLTHSAGFPGALGFDFDFIGRDELVAKALAAPLEFLPGTSYEYSNVGYSLLAAILEKVSGKPYAELLRDEVLKPAGMNETGFDPALWPEERLAQGYRPAEDSEEGDEHWGTVVGRYDPRGPSWHLVGNGGLHSTAADMLRFRQALEGDALLSEDSKAKAFARHVAENEEGSSHYGYGWAIWDEPGIGQVVAHNGGNPYFFADFQRYVDEDLLVFLACSRKVSGLGNLGFRLARIVLNPDDAPVARTAVSLQTEGGLEDSPLGRVASRFLEALTTDHAARRKQLAEAMYTQRLVDKAGEERLLGLFDRLSGDLGDFDLLTAKRYGDDRVELTLRPKGGQDRFVVGLDVVDGRVDGVGVEVTN